MNFINRHRVNRREFFLVLIFYIHINVTIFVDSRDARESTAAAAHRNSVIVTTTNRVIITDNFRDGEQREFHAARQRDRFRQHNITMAMISII